VAADVAPPERAKRLEGLRSRPAITLNREMEIYPGRVSRVTAQLRERGFEADQIDDVPQAWSPDQVIWVWGNAAWFPKVFDSIAKLPPARRPAVVLWHSEPLPPPRAASLRWPTPTVRELGKILLRDVRASDVYTNYWEIRKLVRAGLPDVIAVTSRERQKFLTERGIAAEFVPDGAEEMDGEDLGLERDIDVLLLGAHRLRSRKRALRMLRRAGIQIEAKGDYFDPSLWGENRTRLINRTKIMLSISRFPGTFATARFLMAMACNALVVSDPLFDSAPYVPGAHFVEAPLDDLSVTIERYLTDEPERRRIAQSGHDLVTGQLTIEQTFGRLFEIVADRLAR